VYYVLAPVLLALVFGLPLVAAAGVVRAVPLEPWGLLLAPPTYGVAFVLAAGLLSLPWQSSVVPGRFPRDLGDRLYRGRRLYGLCWTAVYYFTPLYYVCLSVPLLKRLLFRLFGYRGSMDFTVYPDTWIRDLPLLSFGPRAYVSNKATLGTNVCLNDGTILVDRIELGAGAMVGHLSMLAPGVVMEDGSEIGIGTAIGVKARLGPRVSVGGICTVSHLSVLEAGVSTGTAVDIGAAVRIGPKIHVRPGAFVPNRSRWATQADADRALDAVPEAGRHATGVGALASAALGPAPEPSARNGDRKPAAAVDGGSSAEFRANWNAFE
jgi:acetyltransferase-like isoleucine patch superfamily enzyme